MTAGVGRWRNEGFAVVMKKTDANSTPTAPGAEDTGPGPSKRAPVPAELTDLGVVGAPPAEVLHTLGEGGAGKVEAVFDHVLRRTAAKKSLHPELESRAHKIRQFVREARITSQLDHPNIVPVHELGVDRDGRLFFTLKRVEGSTLAQLIDGWREVGVEEGVLLDVLDALVKVCDALSLAHARDVVHCDVKPDNIMIGDHGETYLMDWGAALVLPERLRADGRPRARAPHHPRPCLPGDSPDDFVGGTPGYMAPEQARGEADLIDARTDVFGVGATLYEVLTGRSPYADVDEYAAIEFAARAHYAPLCELIEEEFIPPLLARVITRSMSAEMDDRYPSVEHLKAELVRYIRGGREFPVMRFEPGTVIVRQGDEADCAYIIARGHCEVAKELDGRRIPVRKLGPGEVFGETALLSPGPRTASVIAVDEVSVQVIHRDVLSYELNSTRPWLSKLVTTVAQRFREADARREPPLALDGPVQVAKRATMFLHTWGTVGPDGCLETAWSRLRDELTAGDTRHAALLGARLESFPAWRIEPERDRVSLSDPRAFAEFLAGQLGL